MNEPFKLQTIQNVTLIFRVFIASDSRSAHAGADLLPAATRLSATVAAAAAVDYHK
jgi:hypothetical protein